MKKSLVIILCFLVPASINAQKAITDTLFRVGINNGVPAGQLHIGDGTGTHDLRIDADQSKMRLLSSGAGHNAWFQWGQEWVSGSTADLHFSGIYGQPYFMTIKANGNVGIGNSNPTAKLDVKHGHIRTFNTGTKGGAILQSMYNPETGYARAIFSHNAYWDFTNSSWKIEGIGANDAQAILIPNKGGFNFIIHDSDGNFDKSLTNVDFVAGTKMILNKNGNLGIGTMNPGAFKLAVNGNIRAKEVKIETGWFDFVFEDDYDLRTLAEVEEFIKVNKHLPEIPSAKEVEENGVNLGEMEGKLLQKIEELTLYIIDQQKEIKTLKERMITLEKAGDRF
ncbi:hypothetical protein QQ020_26665 [Fulvivirgaceae bacterium BMA12]|uniref:Uncharacterized protein n=1 Tax=Agaribacillus aureus TaxID=3051825 RepID=A0ABT8LD58_9BACT|nr:hypothetical protein [Fulvivirgaceae bacterium BMA12]